ncbi:hypothetical protein [Parapedobacter koreensis]|uniref:GDSL-like Lipase/Acylhydrolase family protein n=1 Tax=Parapedobacter koreensis TaxID=332977 RepID=A0A1H7T5X8_9SPHI|nr:hypothetical protein [Parapedobacter koreensis]SEL80213.1 hypothetical protein SAMN05421740_110109 [Parapedobacter koreensis]
MFLFFRNLLLFLLFSGIFYVFGTALIGIFAPRLTKNLNYRIGTGGNLYTRIRDADTVKNVDVMVLGSSHAYRSFDPRLFKKHRLSMFNLGSSAQSYLQTKVMVNRYIDQFNPKLILLEVYAGLLNTDGVESSVDFIANSPIDNDIIKMAFEVNHIKTYNTLIYGLFRQALKLDRGYKEPKTKSNGDVYIPGGFVQTYETINEKELLSFEEENIYRIKSKQAAAFLAIIQELKDRQIPYLLIQTPILSSRFRSYTNVTEIDSFYKQYGPYINLNHELTLPPSSYYDSHHLNQHGVDTMNAYLFKTYGAFIEALIANGNQ